MVTLEEFSRVVSGIYDAAVRPEEWEDALHRIRQLVGGVGAMIVSAPESSRAVRFATTLPTEAGTSYQQYYHFLDNELLAVEHGPVGTVRSSGELAAVGRSAEFYTDWMRPFELESGLFVRLTGGPSPVCFIVGSSRTPEDLEKSDGIRIMTALIPHLQRALRTEAKLGQAIRGDGHLVEALELQRRGLIIFGPECQVLQINSSAERMLRAEDGLQFRRGHLELESGAAQRAFQSAARDALVGDDSGVRQGSTLLCERRSGKRPYVIHVLPLRHSVQDELVPCDPTAMMLVIDPEMDTETPVLLLRRLFRLTQMECEIAVRISRGAEVKLIAEELCVSLPTVRTHLQHVFDKTGTHRQVELIRLLLLVSP